MCVWLSLAVDRGMGDTNKYSTLLVDATLSILLRPGPCYRIVHQRKCSAAQCSAAQSRVHSTEYHEGASSSDKCDGLPPPPVFSLGRGEKMWVGGYAACCTLRLLVNSTSSSQIRQPFSLAHAAGSSLPKYAEIRAQYIRPGHNTHGVTCSEYRRNPTGFPV